MPILEADINEGPRSRHGTGVACVARGCLHKRSYTKAVSEQLTWQQQPATSAADYRNAR